MCAHVCTCVYDVSSTSIVETFWRKLQEIIPCRTTQKRSATWDNKSVQMVQFISLNQCKAAFRAHMADDKWNFDTDATARTEDAMEALVHTPVMHVAQAAEPAKDAYTQGEWYAAFESGQSTCPRL